MKSGRLVRSTGAVVTESLGRGGTTAIEIGIVKGVLERYNILSVSSLAPIAAAGGEETGGLDDVVSSSDNSSGRDRVVACYRANKVGFQMGELRFDWEKGRPAESRGFEVGLQFAWSNATVF
jgi:hypothetical protein